MSEEPRCESRYAHTHRCTRPVGHTQACDHGWRHRDPLQERCEGRVPYTVRCRLSEGHAGSHRDAGKGGNSWPNADTLTPRAPRTELTIAEVRQRYTGEDVWVTSVLNKGGERKTRRRKTNKLKTMPKAARHVVFEASEGHCIYCGLPVHGVYDIDHAHHGEALIRGIAHHGKYGCNYVFGILEKRFKGETARVLRHAADMFDRGHGLREGAE